MDVERFLPVSIMVGDQKIGPDDRLRAVMAALCGEKKITLKPTPQLPDFEDYDTAYSALYGINHLPRRKYGKNLYHSRQ